MAGRIIGVENWRPVIGYEGFYEVSDQGRIKSVARVIIRSDGRPKSIHEHILKQVMHGKYYAVSLWRSGIGRSIDVHRVVAVAFIGPCPDGEWVCHNNGK